MHKLSILLITLFLLAACTSKDQELNLLAEGNKWQGDESVVLSNDTLVIEGEYKTLTFNPGLFKTFVNFELSATLLTKPGAHAALLFHTNKKYTDMGYEVRIDNSEVGNWDRLLKTGSLTSIRNINYKMIEDDEWFNLKIRVVENHIQISINDYPVVDYLEPEIPFRTPKNQKRRLNAGTFGIKTYYGNTSFLIKDFRVSSLPSTDPIMNKDPEFTRQISQLHNRNLPLVDYHVHEKGDLTLPFLIERSAKLGINYGVAANCGLKFPIQTDEELRDYQESINGMPIFKAMQAEGREWVDMFSPDLISEFDYAFTDAMTWTNKKGKRLRLWIPEETEVGDPEDFMEQLVSQIEKVVTEPIAIYVNPTYLPEEIAPLYDSLWTEDRIDRVVAALLENNVALEINSRLQLPGSRVIAKAKEAGVKFALGTNNTDSGNLGRLEWALQVIDDHNLQPGDMFLPGEK
ncbi:MAG: DUF1080 domain-containing protein [Bacteroidales bacterium]|jgi:hypothetical protein|nr:DUF1080 domain-containing protein [Bacteroidales bacterium]